MGIDTHREASIESAKVREHWEKGGLVQFKQRLADGTWTHWQLFYPDDDDVAPPAFNDKDIRWRIRREPPPLFGLWHPTLGWAGAFSTSKAALIKDNLHLLKEETEYEVVELGVVSKQTGEPQ